MMMVSFIMNPPRTSCFGLRSFNVSFFTASLTLGLSFIMFLRVIDCLLV